MKLLLIIFAMLYMAPSYAVNTWAAYYTPELEDFYPPAQKKPRSFVYCTQMATKPTAGAIVTENVFLHVRPSRWCYVVEGELCWEAHHLDYSNFDAKCLPE